MPPHFLLCPPIALEYTSIMKLIANLQSNNQPVSLSPPSDIEPMS